MDLKQIFFFSVWKIHGKGKVNKRDTRNTNGKDPVIVETPEASSGRPSGEDFSTCHFFV